jgi:hypothetical protein
MCDPLTLGSLAIGAAGTAANSIGQAKAAKKQNEEYAAWANLQRENRAAENVRQQDYNAQAEAALNQGIADVSGENQNAIQDAEQARLEKALAGESDTNTAEQNDAQTVADAAISGGQYGGDVYQADFAKQLSDSIASAKDRIKALATVQSFGDSSMGLGRQNMRNQAEAGAGIDRANDLARGSLAAYDIEQKVDPVDIGTYSNPIADVASQFLGVGFQGAGQSLAGNSTSGVSNIFGNVFKKKGSSSAGLSATSPYTGLF